MKPLEQKKHREFYIRIPSDGFSHDFITNISGSSQWPGREVKLIEMSAIIEMEKRAEELEKRLEDMRKIFNSEGDKLSLELQRCELRADELKAKLEKAAAAFERVNKNNDDMDAVRSFSNEALKEIRK